MLYIWWDQNGIVYFELLQPGTTINAQLYKGQFIQLNLELQYTRSEYAKRNEKVIFQHDNARPLVAKLVKETLETLGLEVLPDPPYSPEFEPSDYHLFRSMHSALTGENRIFLQWNPFVARKMVEDYCFREKLF